MALTYLGGNLHRVLTRGDGKKGLDVTHLVKHLVPNKITTGLSKSLLQITGEIVAPKSIKNARNYASGALNLKDVEEFQTRQLHFIAYHAEPFLHDTFTNSPVAILKPVEIDDARVSRATLHNMAHIEALGLEIGCKVEVIRSGEIIPRIVRRVD